MGLLKSLHTEPMEVPASALRIDLDMSREADDLGDWPLVDPCLLEAALQQANDLSYLRGQKELDAKRQDRCRRLNGLGKPLSKPVMQRAASRGGFALCR